jgi:acylphosphatase
VRNLADGRVEVVAEGAAVELEAFLEGIDATGLSDFIASKTVKWENAKGGLRGFTIGH